VTSMTDECIFKKLIRELIHEEMDRICEEFKPIIREMVAEEYERRILERLKPVIREMIAEEYDRRSPEIPDKTISEMNAAPPPPDPGVERLPEKPEPENIPGTVPEDAPGLVPAQESMPGPIPETENNRIPPPIPENDSAIQYNTPDESEGLYIYGIIDSPADIRLGDIGIDGAGTYTIPFRDISAIVHQCPAKPYQSEDTETVNTWVASHQNVLDIVSEQFGMVLPFGFDTIITSNGTESTGEVFQNWITEEYERLRNKLDRIHGKKEYGVQVFYHPSTMSDKVLTDSDVIRSLKEEMESKGPGVAYMYRKKIEQAVEQEMSVLVDAEFNDMFGQITGLSDDTKAEKVKRTGEKDKVMMMNLSCLVTDEHYPELGDVLEIMNDRKEYSVRFTGPWPPYSFV